MQNIVEGLEKAAHTFYTLDGAEKLRDAVKSFTGGDLVVVVPRAPFKCPPAPYEMMLLLHSLFSSQSQSKHIRAKTNMRVYTVEPAPMSTGGPEAGAFIRQQLTESKIDFHPNVKLSRVLLSDSSQSDSSDGKTLEKTSVKTSVKTLVFEDGSTAVCDGLLIAVPPHQAPRAVLDSGLAGPSGYIPVDRRMRVLRPVPPGPSSSSSAQGPASSTVASSRLYAIGDVTSVPLPGRFRPEVPLSLPKAGAFAIKQGDVSTNASRAHTRPLKFFLKHISYIY